MNSLLVIILFKIRFLKFSSSFKQRINLIVYHPQCVVGRRFEGAERVGLGIDFPDNCATLKLEFWLSHFGLFHRDQCNSFVYRSEIAGS